MLGDLDPTGLVFKSGRNKGKPQIVVDDETGCWIWQGTKNKGYGRIRDGKKASKQAHVYFYEQYVGPVAQDIELGHVCHRRSCCNPAHVEPVTRDTNQRDRYKIPTLSLVVRNAISECFDNDLPNGVIARQFGISHFAVRHLARQHLWRSQIPLDIDDVPF